MRTLAGIACALVACSGRGHDNRAAGSGGGSNAAAPAVGAAGTASCPATAPAPSPLPGVDPKQRTLDYWLEHTPDLDTVLLDTNQIRDANDSLVVDRGDDWHGDYDLMAPVDRDKLATDIASRVTKAREKLVSGELLDESGKPLAAPALAAFDPAHAAALALAPELHVALDTIAIRCFPRAEMLVAKPQPGANINPRFDRNNCSSAHAQEVIEILAEWPGGMRLARTRYATGWIAPDAKLSPAIPQALQTLYVHGPHVIADADLAVHTANAPASCPAGTLLPVAGTTRETRVSVADTAGFHEIALPADRVESTRRPLTRRALLTEAFRFLDTPFGWGGGGAAGGHDCSAFLMDLFGTFDIRLPRHSAWQTRAGTFSIDVSQVKSNDERLRLIDAAAKRGVVLLGLPGHIMLYLGRSDAGVPMVIHAIAEYLAPCKGGGETAFQIDKITVSGLDLGAGTSRTSLLDRLTRITVIGASPGVELAGASELRPAAPVALPAKNACRDSDEVRIFSSPEAASSKQAMRVIVTSNHDPGPTELAVFDPSGAQVTPTSVVKLAGGPPWSVIATIDAPHAGTWTAVLGDGSRVEACRRISVHTQAPRPRDGAVTGPVWALERKWTPATENLYATFVQRLFDFPPDQDVTWPDLHTLLRDPAHNILFGHLGRDEDNALTFQPDCADLPYLLRSYFAWKLGLPFGYRECSRGSATHAPTCTEVLSTNLVARSLLDDKPNPDEEPAPLGARTESPPADGSEQKPIGDIEAFSLFWRAHVSRAAQAASGRTLPEDELTDYYPVPLTRSSLRPGTAYHDPYGHVMVIASWVPQGTTTYGMLLAADAQPDGTVGRKRFWRGNFLMSTDTKVAGAGFKAFRPLAFDDAAQAITPLDNKALRRTRQFAPFSTQQYEGTLDTFYDSVEALIDPRPLDPVAALTALVDSLHSQAKLRIVSVKNGEDWVAAHPGESVPMPDGSDIFLTTGPWEDFATPSRDFRLLIAIDTVLGFRASVERAPQLFALDPAVPLAKTLASLDATVDKLLRERSIEYTRSDGTAQKLTMRELVDRRLGFEISYNPNDCVEVRWAAAQGTPEMASCKRHAPPDQQAKLEELRPWFHERRRPAR